MPVRWFFLHNSGSKLGSKKIQMGIPMFLGIAYQIAASEITSLGRHIGFQDGRRQNDTYDIGSIFYRVTVNVMEMSQLLE